VTLFTLGFRLFFIQLQINKQNSHLSNMTAQLLIVAWLLLVGPPISLSSTLPTNLVDVHKKIPEKSCRRAMDKSMQLACNRAARISDRYARSYETDMKIKLKHSGLLGVVGQLRGGAEQESWDVNIENAVPFAGLATGDYPEPEELERLDENNKKMCNDLEQAQASLGGVPVDQGCSQDADTDETESRLANIITTSANPESNEDDEHDTNFLRELTSSRVPRHTFPQSTKTTGGGAGPGVCGDKKEEPTPTFKITPWSPERLSLAVTLPGSEVHPLRF
jgi:hypothetical protein